MEHAKHAFRAAFVLIAGLGAFLLARGQLVPKSYGLHGAYRYDNVLEQMQARTPAHAGAGSCAACHKEQFAKRAEGSHKNVNCEVCHMALAAHVMADGKIEPAPVDRSYALCARCHRKVLGRPSTFPQVVLEQHVKGPLESKPCIQCHEAHSPAI
jgi:hypothetical protein